MVVLHFGLIASAQAAPPKFKGKNISTDPGVRVQAYRGKPQSPFVNCRVHPVREKLFADEHVRAVEIRVSQDNKSGAHLSSTLTVTKADAGTRPLSFYFSTIGDSKVTLTVTYIRNTGVTNKAMDLISLCEGKELTP